MAKDYGLTQKQRNFADAYLASGHAGNSYRTAFEVDGKKLKQSTCSTEGSKLLKNPNVKNYLEDRRKELTKKAVMTADEILQEIASIAVDTTVRPSDRLKALELLGKNQAMFTDKVEQSGAMEIEINLTGDEEEDE